MFLIPCKALVVVILPNLNISVLIHLYRAYRMGKVQKIKPDDLNAFLCLSSRVQILCIPAHCHDVIKKHVITTDFLTSDTLSKW